MDQLTDVCTAISHPTRRAILGRLASGPARFTDIAEPFDTALNSVTKHLKLLERAGLIERKKQGREVLISLQAEPLREVAKWVHEYEQFWNNRLDQFEQHFKDKKEKGDEEMSEPKKTIELKVHRTIPAPAGEVFDAWLNPKTPGSPWSMAEKLILNPEVDGFFYWLIQGTAHYGRFTDVQRPDRLQHTWMSRNTAGEESMVTVTFQKKGEDTQMTLVHSGLPDTEAGRGHEKGWNFFLDGFAQQFPSPSQLQK